MSGGRPCVNDIKGSNTLSKLPGIFGIRCIVSNNLYLFYSKNNMLTRSRACISSLHLNRLKSNLTEEWNLCGKENFECIEIEVTSESSRLDYWKTVYEVKDNRKNPGNKGVKRGDPWNKLDRSMIKNIDNVVDKIGIYYMKNINSDKMYIGYGNCRSRILDHTKMLIKGTHWIEDFQNDWNLDNTCWEVGNLELTENFKQEEYWIRYYKSHLKEFGYNTKLGRKLDNATKKKISEIHKNNPTKGMLGKHHSIETRLEGHCYTLSIELVKKIKYLHDMGLTYSKISSIVNLPVYKIGYLLRDKDFIKEVLEHDK